MTRATVKIQLDGEEFELVPTLAAMEHLNKKYENFQSVYSRLASMNFDCYADVIIAGLLHMPKKADLNGTKQAVFEAGIIALMPSLVRFVSILLNGGREIKEGEEEEEQRNPE